MIVTGTAARVTAAESAAYFHSRPRDSQLASAASAQSSVVASRAVLEASVAALARRYPGGGPRAGELGRLPGHAGLGRVLAGPGRRGCTTGCGTGSAPTTGWVVERLSP